jgi:hypothetical protein
MAVTTYFPKSFRLPLLALSAAVACAFKPGPHVKFVRHMIAAESYESVAAFDVNGDGNLDIVSGDFWYEGPDFVTRHYIGGFNRTGSGEYWDDFATIPLDVNEDGRTDFVTGDWFTKAIWWRENPGNNGEWKRHMIDTTGNVECMEGWDVDGDGTIEIVPNNPHNPLKFYKLLPKDRRAAGSAFMKVPVAPTQGHGLGFGDVNGDGRGDFVVSDGWLEAPRDPLKGKWVLHKSFDLGTASIPVLVEDVNGDGINDVIAGDAHGYGLNWYEQKRSASGGTTWVKHPIDPFNSQYHTMRWVDIDGDGKGELVTGKRYRAHNGGDPGSGDPIGLYYFKWNGESFTKNVISYGPLGQGKGTGLYFVTADLHKTGRQDIIVAGKDGLYVFYNEEAP